MKIHVLFFVVFIFNPTFRPFAHCILHCKLTVWKLVRDKCLNKRTTIKVSSVKVLVTGGTGFIGRRLIEKLTEEEHKVHAFVRSTSNRSGLPETVIFKEGDLLNFESLENAIEGMDAVIHLAAYFDFYPKNVDLLYKVNVEGTKNLMNACIGSSVERFVYCSTTETIGPVRYPPANEDTELRPQFDYGESKVLAEKVVREISSDTGLNHVILRPTGVMGEGDLYTAYELIKALNDGEIPVLPGDGKKHIMYSYVDDIVRGFTAALSSQSALNSTIILCPDEPMTYNELIEFLTNYLNVEPPKRRIPTSLAKIGIGLLSPIKNRGRNTFLWHTKTIQSMDEDRWYENNRAKRLLGWTPKFSMQDGLKRAIDWYYEHDYLERRN
ncbi:MAG: NAD-dependent epimerase/dehydratase family protein [Candidatus Lokiarchaeota archaeon]|nr:NAD-dependent epimerase/dehydratase family protein [Candidatus Lokiarchaeota archaeon]